MFAAGALTLGGVLSNLLQDVDHLISHAGNVGKDTLIEAANQTRRSIEQAQIAFNQSLGLTADKVDDTSRRIIDRLETLATNVTAQQQQGLAAAASDAQGIVNDLISGGSIFISNGILVPRLMSATPRFISSLNDPVEFVFKGNFPIFGNTSPTLDFNGVTLIPTGAETTVPRLGFSATYASLFPQDGNRTNILSIAGQLNIPYAQGTAIYRVFLRSLPPSPGTITLETTTIHKRKEVRTIERGRYAAFVTPGYGDQAWHICSCSTDDCISKTGHQPTDTAYLGKNNNETRELFALAAEGWTIIAGTSDCRLEVLQGGSYSKTRTTENDSRVGYTVSTQHHTAGTSDSLNVNISYQEQRKYDDTVVKTSNIALKWGNSRVISRADLADACNTSCIGGCASSWKVTFIDFRGGHNESSTSLQNNYLTIVDNGAAGITLSAPAASSLAELQ